MGNSAERFIRSLEDAADNIDTMKKSDIQAMLRRAAIRLRGATYPRELEEAYNALLAEMNEANRE